MFSKIKADPRLLRIEQAGGLDGGLGPLLQKSLSNYDDSMLRSELGGASEEILNAGGIHENIFVDISQSASAGYISEGEARRLFRQGLAIETRLGASADAVSAPPALFDILLNILFKKLQILHLTRDICSHRLMVASSTKSLDFYRTRSIEEVQKNKTSKRGTSKQQLRSTTPLSDLRNQLKNSSIIQQKLDKKIASNLTLLSQTVSLADHTSAAAFSKQWKSTLKSMNAEIFSIRFLRLLGATKLWEYAWGQATKKKLRYIRKWYLITMSINRADAERSAVIMQSVIRGGLGRERVRQIRRNRAAVTIQKRHRGYLGRLRMMDRRAHLCLCAAVAVVERAYQRHIWVRAGNRMRLMLRRDKACRKIQCAQRAHRASVFIIRIRRARLERANALKIQSQWRRYLASMRVDNIRRRRLWLDATLLLQRVARGMLDRLFVMDRREMIQAAVLIQCAWRSSVARFVVQERRKKFNATIIQKTIRGLWGRKRFRQIYNVQRDALAQIARGVRGYIDRKKYKPIIAAFTARRSVASAILAIRLKALHTGMKDRRKVKRMMASVIRMQMFIRRVLFNKRASLRETRRKNMAAKEIQRIARGYNDRRLVLKLREEKDRLDKLKDRNKIPLYYRVYQNYLRDQFLLHRPMILILQCFFRVTRARRRVNFLRQTAAVKKIQRTCRRHLQTKHAREALRKKRLAKLYRNECAIHINKVVRGFLGRRYINKIHMANTIKWFFEQMRSKGLASRVFDSFRMRKRNMQKAISAATKIQGLARGRAGRNYLRYNHKRLVKERRLRILRKRNKAAKSIQGLYHIMLAKNIANMKRQERAVREAEEKMYQDLEGRIDGIHGEHMLGLMTTRMQTGARVKLAKKTKKQLAEERKREAEQKKEQRRCDAAVKIQAMARGVRFREIFKKKEQQLKKERQARNFCIECESQVATKRCRQCKDRFCDSCFDILHRTGLRKRHLYEFVGPAALVTNKYAGIPASNPLLWEECFDEMAQGRYWYNKQTGEASWICPF